jgi:hypothetical protein
VLLGEIARLDRRRERPALPHRQDLGAHGLVWTPGAEADTPRGAVRARGGAHS